MNLHYQTSPYTSPWTLNQRIKMFVWEYAWLLLCAWTPKPANKWRIFWLKVFGAEIFGQPFVHQRARIQIPWNLIMHDRSALGDRAHAYSLGKIEIHEHATVAQEAYICTGTHAFHEPAKNLVTAPITIGAHAFVGARAFILPGVTVGEHAIVGACSLVTKDVLPYATVKGNPAR
ncbi:DapH/DapD/GlmU-related protein [Hymenobacter crusticola]|uniref:Putative colanic acid biosynthesis acetyltransferase n=1 Tax=Hymenobacter crusticola TaxID=1770526 RepID=A0A243WAB8_9BACT|nr:DapH/DapD/GlmU-related protein [Hymenobacter crusticola]OUJ71204.1 putative colanic acid biosynthesis acetyltransferase [Hymenobacter crusticola]